MVRDLRDDDDDDTADCTNRGTRGPSSYSKSRRERVRKTYLLTDDESRL